jgi:hypothetical protein
MCIPPKQSDCSDTTTRSILGIGVLMLLACLAGPVLTGLVGGLGAGALLGAGGAIAAFALCAAVPAVVVARNRRRAD